MDLSGLTFDDLRGKSARELEDFTAAIDDEIRASYVVDGHTRNMDGSEREQFTVALSVRDEAARRAEQLREVENVFRTRPHASETAQFGGSFIRGSVDTDPTDVLRMSGDQARSSALRAVETRGRHLAGSVADQMDQVIRSTLSADNQNLDGGYIAKRTLITESDAYRSGWRKVVTDPHPLLTQEEIRALQSLKELDRVETRAMGDFTNSAGGYGVPVFIDPSIILSSQGSVAPIRNLARTETITTNIWKGVSSAGVTWAFQTEGAIVSDNSPTLAQPTVSVHMARGWLPFSIEVQGDYPGFADEMATLLASGYDELLASKLMTGSGTGEPGGLITRLDATAGSEILVTTAGTLGSGDIDRAWEGLPDRFKGRSSWLTSYGVSDQIAALSTLNAGSIAYQTVDLTGVVQTVRTRPLYPTSYGFTSRLSGTSHQNSAVVGDFNNYLIAQRAGMNIELVPMLFQQVTAGSGTAAPTGQRGWFSWGRVGGDTLVNDAFRLINQT